MSIFNDKALKSVAEAAAKVMQQEELKGNQHKIDANKNGKVDAHDFKLLRGKKNLKEDDTGYQDRYAVKNGKAVKHNPMRGERDEPHHVWADSAEHAVRKHAAKNNAPMKEDVQQLDEIGDTPAGQQRLLKTFKRANRFAEANMDDLGDKTMERSSARMSDTTKNKRSVFEPKVKNPQAHKSDRPGLISRAAGAVKKVLTREEVDYLQESFADAVERVKAANGGKLPSSGKPVLPKLKVGGVQASDKPKAKKDNTGRDYFGHDSVRQQSGYRGPGQSVLQTGADAIAKGAKAVGKAVKKSGIGKSVVGGIKAVKSAVKKTFSREEVEFIFNNFMLEDIQYFMISEEYEMLDESSREMFEYFFEEQSLNEGFPTVADAKKRMDAGKTATGSVTKTKTGLVHKRDYKDDDAEEAQKKSTGYGARQNYKRSTRVNEQLSFTEMLELYNEHGLKVLAPIETEEMDIDGTTIQVIDGDKINGYVETTVEEGIMDVARGAVGVVKDVISKEKTYQAQKQKKAGEVLRKLRKEESLSEEPTNDEFTKEFEDQKASFEGKKKQPKVAAGKTTGVKEMPESVELEERELSKDEAKKKEDYVKGMKKGLSGFKERYGERAKSVMYGAATNMAKKD